MGVAIHPHAKDRGAEMLVDKNIIKNMTRACMRGFGMVEPCHLVAAPVLEECVCHNQLIHGTEIQQTYTIFLLLLRPKPTNGSMTSHCIIPHSEIEILHDQQHNIPWNLPHTLLEVFIKRYKIFFICRLICWSIYSNNGKKASVGPQPQLRHPLRHTVQY